MKLLRRLMPAAQAVRSCYWRIAKPASLGVRAIITDGENVVLVRHSYTCGWYLPGGKVTRTETVLDALWRELDEELGLDPPQTPPQLLGLYASTREAKRDHIAVYIVNGGATGGALGMEVLDRQAFLLDDLPADLSPGTARRLAEFNGIRPIGHTW
ncbi:MAG: NUDIX domain-containing protein [Egibacteraceae bacterium]